MVVAEFAGVGRGWGHVAWALHQQKYVQDRTAADLRWAETFGHWIGNTDMHLGNISLTPTSRGFDLLPIYDMLPMAFAPIRGDLPEVSLRPPIRVVAEKAMWQETREAAADYWSRIAGDEEVSASFRDIAARQARQCNDLG